VPLSLFPIPGLYSAHWQVTHSSGCMCVRDPSPFPTVASNLQPVLQHAGVVSAQNRMTGELCVAVSPISWQRNLNLCGSPRSSSESGGLWTLYQSALGLVSMLLTALDRTSLRCQGRSSGSEFVESILHTCILLLMFKSLLKAKRGQSLRTKAKVGSSSPQTFF